MTNSLPNRLKEFCEFDTNKAHRLICDIASGKHRWQMCVPPQADDSDMVLQAPLDHLDRLKPVLDALVECVEAMKLSLEFHACETYHLPPTGIPLDMALSNLESLLNEMEKK